MGESTQNRGLKVENYPRLPERVDAPPLQEYCRYVIDRLRVTQYLWNYENSEFVRTRHTPLIDINQQDETIKHIKEVFQKKDAFYHADTTKGEGYDHARPPWTNGVPTHTTSVPLNTNSEVIKQGYEWYKNLAPSFRHIVQELHSEWGADSVVSNMLERLEEKLLTAFDPKLEVPVEFVNPERLVEILLENSSRVSIHPDDVTSIGENLSTSEATQEMNLLMNHSLDRHRIANPIFTAALRQLLLSDLVTTQ